MLQETHTTEESERVWSDLTGYNCYFAHGTTESKGIATLIPKSLCAHVNNVIRDREGRFLLLDVLLNDVNYVLLNTYAPTKDKRILQLSFLDNLSDILKEYVDKRIIWAGDLNTYLQPDIDKYGGVQETPSDYALRLIGLMEFYDVIDIWRVRNPDKRMFTWRNRTKAGIVQSRIDYILVSASISYAVKKTDIVPGIRSDHSMLIITVESDNSDKRGKGFWKFNASLIKDKEYVAMVKKCIEDTKKENKNLVDKSLLWDLIKCQIRGATVSYSIRKRMLERKHECNILREIVNLESKLANGETNVMQDLVALKEEYDNIQNVKAQGSVIRSKAKYAEYGEKNTKFFFNLEKRNYDAKHIKSLITEHGIVSEPDKVLEAEKEFYCNLYTEKVDRSDTPHGIKFLANEKVKTVSVSTCELCERPVTLVECHKALSDMTNNKTPGSDGFSVEFYKFFWADVNDLVLNSFNYSFASGSLSVEQRRGVITVIPKRDKDVRYLKNWRPISLLNTDYKILTKVLANRLQVALREIISADQTGYIKGRYIGENVRVIETYSTLNKARGYIVLLDFEKAFDTVNIDFLKKALITYKFGPNFCKWIELLYTNVSSCVTNNGHASEFFPVTRGIRQGCPISAMLFIMIVELLANYLKSSDNIKGIDIDDESFIITQLADDTTLFLQDINSITNAMYVLDSFYECSGLRLNKQKCEVFILGNCGQSNNVPDTIAGLKCVSGSFKALGIHFNNNLDDMLQKNFMEKVKKLHVLINIWSQRDLSLKGKVIVLKSILIPTVLFQCTNLYVPQWFVSQVNNLLFKFVWNNKPAKIKSETLIGDIDNGGIRMPYFPSVVQSLKVIWIQRLLDTSNSKWKKLAWKLMNISEFDLLCKNDVKFLTPKSLFYKQVLDSWYKLHSQKPACATDIGNEILWNNRYITVEGQPVLYKHWIDKGIININHLLTCNGKLLSPDDLKSKYNLTTTFMEYSSLVSAIPKQWLQKPSNKTVYELSDMHNLFHDNVSKLNSKNVYWKLIQELVKEPTALSQWISQFPFMLDGDFKDIFTLPSQITRNTKLQCFQFKILHRIFPCNYMLSKWGITDNKNCTTCNVPDTVEHYFFYCSKCKEFWSSVENWFKKISGVYIPLKIVSVLFGITFKKTQDDLLSILNFIILHAKMYIYLCKREEKPIHIQSFLKYFKYVLKIEREILILSNNEQEFERKWSIVQDAM